MRNNPPRSSGVVAHSNSKKDTLRKERNVGFDGSSHHFVCLCFGRLDACLHARPNQRRQISLEGKSANVFAAQRLKTKEMEARASDIKSIVQNSKPVKVAHKPHNRFCPVAGAPLMWICAQLLLIRFKKLRGQYGL